VSSPVEEEDNGLVVPEEEDLVVVDMVFEKAVVPIREMRGLVLVRDPPKIAKSATAVVVVARMLRLAVFRTFVVCLLRLVIWSCAVFVVVVDVTVDGIARP